MENNGNQLTRGNEQMTHVFTSNIAIILINDLRLNF